MEPESSTEMCSVGKVPDFAEPMPALVKQAASHTSLRLALFALTCHTSATNPCHSHAARLPSTRQPTLTQFLLAESPDFSVDRLQVQSIGAIDMATCVGSSLASLSSKDVNEEPSACSPVVSGLTSPQAEELGFLCVSTTAGLPYRSCSLTSSSPLRPLSHSCISPRVFLCFAPHCPPWR